MIFSITKQAPSDCKTIEDVRTEIDTIDKVIMELLARRFEYVKEVVKYKAGTADSVVAEERRTAVLSQRRAWAEELGLCPDVIEEMYVHLIDYFIDEEKKILKIE